MGQPDEENERMVTQGNYFDLWDVFVNELIGDVWLALFVGLIVILWISIKTKIPYQVSILYLVLWFGIGYAATFISVIWALLIMFIGLLFYFRMSKIFK